MTKRTYILFIFIFGFLNIPKDASACGSDSEKDCCKKEVSHHSTKKSCENDVKNQKKSDNKDDDCCDENCQHHSCHCSTFNFNQFLPFSTELRSFYSLITKEKRQLIFNETFLSTGFYSIWSPPNISY